LICKTEYARTESFCANEIKISAAAERSEIIKIPGQTNLAAIKPLKPALELNLAVASAPASCGSLS